MLSDKEQRSEYDQIRAMGAGGARFTSGGQGFEDIFGGMFGGGMGGAAAGGQRFTFQQGGGAGGYEDLFGGMFDGGPRAPRGPRPGRDLTASTTIDFETAVRGDTVMLQTPNGQVKVKIPAGIEDGKRIRVRGKGEPSPDGGPAGACAHR